LNSFGVAFGVGDGEGIAIAPINGTVRGVGVASGITIFPTTSFLLLKRESTKRLPSTLKIIANAAEAKTDIRCFTFAHPTGQSCVRIVPSAL
jgi:hypothetical protein